jgi:hypothetical protein
MNASIELVARARHEEDLRRASEYRLVRESRSREASLGLVWKLFSRLALSDEPGSEPRKEQTPRPAL